MQLTETKKEEFIILRDNIFLKLKKLLSTPSIDPKIIRRLSYCICIIMIIGVVNIWTTCIEDIISFGKTSLDNAWVALTIIESMKSELDQINETDLLSSEVSVF